MENAESPIIQSFKLQIRSVRTNRHQTMAANWILRDKLYSSYYIRPLVSLKPIADIG